MAKRTSYPRRYSSHPASCQRPCPIEGTWAIAARGPRRHPPLFPQPARAARAAGYGPGRCRPSPRSGADTPGTAASPPCSRSSPRSTDGRPLRDVLATVLDHHPNGPRPYLGACLTCPLIAPSLKGWSLRQTRRGWIRLDAWAARFVGRSCAPEPLPPRWSALTPRAPAPHAGTASVTSCGTRRGANPPAQPARARAERRRIRRYPRAATTTAGTANSGRRSTRRPSA